MIDWKRKYYIVLALLIFIVIIWNIQILVLAIRIEQKDNEIWQQKVEIEDLKEQLDRERIKK
ncbi:hypothetical protein [Faecalibacillus faecis]|uniref:hypothetical protein n=1 Tax=Faecalibacillus faecis TaxID=1982628 RepID=UPI00386556A9